MQDKLHEAAKTGDYNKIVELSKNRELDVNAPHSAWFKGCGFCCTRWSTKDFAIFN